MCHLVACDLAEAPCEPGLRVDIVELGRFDQGEGDHRGFAPPCDPANIQCFRLMATGFQADSRFRNQAT